MAWLRADATCRSARGATALVILILFLQLLARASRPAGNDFTSYLLSASALWEGRNPYATSTVFPYIYPLFLALALIPSTAVPHLVAQALWFGLGLASLWAACRLLVTMAAQLGWDRIDRMEAPLAFLGLFLLDPIQINLLNGQANFVVLLLLVLFLRAHRAGGTAWASLFLALAAAIKLVPLVLLGFLAARRAFGTLGLTLALTALLCAVPYVCTGGQLWALYEGYLQSFLLPRALAPPVWRQEIVFSLPGLMGILLPRLPRASAHALSVVLVLGPAMWAAWRRRSGPPAVWTFCLFLLAIPLLTPLSEVHHLAVLFPAAGLSTLHALFRPGRAGRGATALLAAAWVLFWLGRVDRLGPFYFLSLAAFYAASLREALETTAAAATPAPPGLRAEASRGGSESAART